MNSMDEFIKVGSPLPRIRSIAVAGDRNVKVTWRDGRTDLIDLAPAILSHRHFIPLRNDAELFATLRPNEDGTAIEWDGGIELSAEWIERLPSTSMANADFREAMSRLGLSLDGMAAQLEISRRQVAQYRKDKPIPRHIALATRYLVEHPSL